MSDLRTAEVGAVQTIEFRAMGTQVLAAVASDSPEAASILAEVPAWFEAWEQVFSHYRENSELSLLNRAGGSVPVIVSEALWDVLQSALQVARYTGGLVSPTALDPMDTSSYVVSSEAAPRGIFTAPPTTRVHLGSWFSDGSHANRAVRRPSGSVDTGGSALTNWREIKLFPDGRSVQLPRGVGINFGSTGKGWAADKAADRLAKYGPSLVNVGGAISISGPVDGEGAGWPVGIDLPAVHLPGLSHYPSTVMLSIRTGGVATSGRDVRQWQPGDDLAHYIIDPRTGSPADTDIIAATTVAPSACAAEMASRVALLLGSSKGIEWLDDRPPLAGLLLLETGKVAYGSRMGDHLGSVDNRD